MVGRAVHRQRIPPAGTRSTSGPCAGARASACTWGTSPTSIRSSPGKEYESNLEAASPGHPRPGGVSVRASRGRRHTLSSDGRIAGAQAGRSSAFRSRDEIPEREKDDAMAAYLMMFASLAIGLPLPAVQPRRLLRLLPREQEDVPVRRLSFAAVPALPHSHRPRECGPGRLGGRQPRAPGHFLARLFLVPAFTVLLNLAYIVLSIIALVHARKGRFYYMPLLWQARPSPGSTGRGQRRGEEGFLGEQAAGGV